MAASSAEALWKHKLVEKIREAEQPVIEHGLPAIEEAAAKGRFRADVQFPFTASQAYVHNCFMSSIALLDAFDRMAEARAYLEAFPRPQAYESRNVSAYQWMEYHYYHHCVMCAASGDRALVLTNAVAWLDNPPRNCTQQVVLENARIKGSSVEKALTRLMKELESVRGDRNASVHHGRADTLDRKFQSLEIEYLSAFSVPTLRRSLPKGKRPSHKLLGVLYRAGVGAILPRLMETEQKLEARLMAVLDALHPVYERYFAALRLLEVGGEARRGGGA